ncbi:hypothetical protein DVR12_23405 [Chitinophaga silvatica]|uniref:Sel1 repeat family protein n=2 Tax=Chitinophaga silvatica TaxID=2282649 RepID=A0A3E1Y4I2_9BACT|nr:hypothetical protein DVR12_23405 [Chitinophaga silvatica]
MICSLLLSLSLSLFVNAQAPKGFTEKYSTTLSGGGTAFNYEPAMNVWAYVEDQPGITGQQVFWHVKTFFHHYSVIRFVKHIKLTCGNVITRNVRLYDLKDGQTISGATFSGDGDLVDGIFKEDCANKNRIASVWISDVTCELADDDYMMVDEKNRLAKIKADEEARKEAERKRIAEERAAKEKAVAKEREAKEKAEAEARAKAKAKAKSNGSSSGGSNYSYTPVPLTPAQQYSAWLNQYSENLRQQQVEANTQYQKAQDIATQSFANGVSTKQGLQNFQSNMSDLALSQDMSTSAGRTRATAYAAESVAAGIASIFIKEHDYEAEAEQRAENRKREREAEADAEIRRQKIYDEITPFIDADLIWLFVNIDSPADKIFQYNTLNTRYLRVVEIKRAKYWENEKFSAAYGNKASIDFSTGMTTKLWGKISPLQPELSSAFSELIRNDFYYGTGKWERKIRKHTLKGKYGDFKKYAAKGIGSMLFTDKKLHITKDSAIAIEFLQKALDPKATSREENGKVYIQDAIGEFYYDLAVRNNDPKLMLKAFDCFTECLKYAVLNEWKYPGLFQKLYHNQLLAAYRLVMDERTENPEKYLSFVSSQFNRHYGRELGFASAKFDAQANQFYKDGNYEAVFKLHKIFNDTTYHAYDFVRVNSWGRIGSCYANGYGVDKDTVEAMKCYNLLRGSRSWSSIQDSILKLRDPAAFADKFALNHIFYKEIPVTVSKVLEDVKNSDKISTILLGSTDGNYLIRSEKGAVFGKNIADTLYGAIRRAMNSGEKIKQIYLSPDLRAWSVIYGKNYYNTQGMPQGLLNAMTKYYNNGSDISHLAVGPGEGWVVVEGSCGYTFDNIPDALAKGLKQVNTAAGTINLIVFHPQNGWLMVYNDNEYIYENIPQPLLQKLEEYKQKKRPVHNVCFSENGFVIN